MRQFLIKQIYWFSDYLFLFKHLLQSPHIYKYGYTINMTDKSPQVRWEGGGPIIFIFVLSRCGQTIITQVQGRNIDRLGIIGDKRKTKARINVNKLKKKITFLEKKRKMGDCSVISGSVAAVKSS